MATLTTPVSTISFDAKTTIIVAPQTSTTGKQINVSTITYSSINSILIATSPSNNTTQVGVWY